MQIQLKQTEIIAALKQYIGTQGINLSGKTVDISFTAGRKEAGTTADISIEDTGDIPGFTDATDTADAVAVATAKPALSVVSSAPEASAEGEEVRPAQETAAAEKVTTSLFN